MELIRGLWNLRDAHKGCALTIGNFDGMHLGHQALLSQLKAHAEKLNVPTCVIIFEPQPNEFFYADNVPSRLMRLREKLQALRERGIDRVLSLRFDASLAAMSAEDFLSDVLLDKLGMQCIVVGDDFHFGTQRRGDVALLREYAKVHDFSVVLLQTFELAGERVSSTRVRKALDVGDLGRVGQLLGQLFCMAGRVAHGDKRGRIIGFPTANIFLHRRSVPIGGVYVVRVRGLDRVYGGVANVGTRPTVGGTRSLLEVHIFDFAKEIYGAHIEVEFIHKLRDEKRYDNLELLRAQILKDAEAARAYLRAC